MPNWNLGYDNNSAARSGLHNFSMQKQPFSLPSAYSLDYSHELNGGLSLFVKVSKGAKIRYRYN